jgi:hypothetical protein
MRDLVLKDWNEGAINDNASSAPFVDASASLQSVHMYD